MIMSRRVFLLFQSIVVFLASTYAGAATRTLEMIESLW